MGNKYQEKVYKNNQDYKRVYYFSPFIDFFSLLVQLDVKTDAAGNIWFGENRMKRSISSQYKASLADIG